MAADAPPTFHGRLALNSFAYRASSPPPPRQRLHQHTTKASASPPAALPPQPSAAVPRRKRRRRRPTPSPPASPSAGLGPGYVAPSTYAHLPLLPDALGPDLLVLFVGLNPGLQTARCGHAYAHPSNLFWKLLFASGITPRLCRPAEDRSLPALFALGLTNIVARPSRSGAELSRREMDDGVALLLEKARRWRPESVCIVGKSIWESIWRVRHGSPVAGRFRYGWQEPSENMGVVDGIWPGARVFVASSTSGLAASLSPAQKHAIWAELGSWVKTRRTERSPCSPGPARTGTDLTLTPRRRRRHHHHTSLPLPLPPGLGILPANSRGINQTRQ